MMLLRGKRRIYGQGAWRGTILLTALLAVVILCLVLKSRPERASRAAAADGDPAAPLAGELARLKMLGHALRLHADEHGGQFPRTVADIQWRQAMPGMDWNGLPAAASRFHRPGSGELMDWLYFAGHTESDAPETILAASPVTVGPGGDQRMVVRLDGVAGVIAESKFQQQVDEPKAAEAR